MMSAALKSWPASQGAVLGRTVQEALARVRRGRAG